MRLKDNEVCALVLCNNGNPAVPQSNRITTDQSWSNVNQNQTWSNSNKYYSTSDICDNLRSSTNLNSNVQNYAYESIRENLTNFNTGGNLSSADLNNGTSITGYQERYTYITNSNNYDYSNSSDTPCNRGDTGRGELYSDNNIYEADTLEHSRSHGPALSVYSEASPMDSLPEYDDLPQICSSTDASPQDEDDHPFDQSDSEEMSDVNLHPIPRGIINPNYPGFQHFAHTLEDYPLKLDISPLEPCIDIDINPNLSEPIIGDTENIFYENFIDYHQSMQQNNNNENNNDDDNYPISQVNKLESLENIKSIIYDKSNLHTVLNDKENNLNIVSDVSDSVEANVICSYSETDIKNNQNANYESVNEHEAEINYDRSILTTDIIGDFGKEIEQEIGEIVRRNSNFQDDLFALQQDIHDVIQKPLEETINNISDVVNRVIEKIVINQAVDGYQQWLQPVNTCLENEKVCCSSSDEVDNAEDFELPTCNSKVSICNISENISDLSSSSFKNDIILNEKNDFSFDDISSKMVDAFLSNAKDVINAHNVNIKDKIPNFEEQSSIVTDNLKQSNCKVDKSREEKSKLVTGENEKEFKTTLSDHIADNNINEICEKVNIVKKSEPKVQVVKPMIARKEEINTMRLEKDIDCVVLRKKEKSESRSHYIKKLRRDSTANTSCSGGVRSRDNLYRRSLPPPSKKSHNDAYGLFDVYNIETAMPNIDLDAIESHLKAAKEEERRRRNDREEIRRRLAMGTEHDDYYTPSEKPGRKPSLQSRLQSGMNLQICFMNETASDTESPSSDTETKTSSTNDISYMERLNDEAYSSYNFNHPYQTKPLSVSIKKTAEDTIKPKPAGRVRPSSLSLSSVPTKTSLSTAPLTEADFFARQARLQAEARMALAQAKEMARVQMEVERQKQQISPITEMLRSSLKKAGIPLSPDRRRVSRQLLTDMNVAQLQIIVNELHTQIENLNDQLVKFLMARDELHMGQDSMLVDIEDLTRYLGAKEQSIKPTSTPSPVAPKVPISSAVHHHSTFSTPFTSLMTGPAAILRPKLHRIASLVKK